MRRGVLGLDKWSVRDCVTVSCDTSRDKNEWYACVRNRYKRQLSEEEEIMFTADKG